jgi:uncharacterized membrane protein
VLFGLGQVFAKRSLAITSPATNNLLLALVELGLDVPLAVHSGLTLSVFLQLLPAAAFIAATYQVYYFALARGQVSLTGTLIACYPVVTSALSVALLGERFDLVQACGVALTIAGAAVLSVTDRGPAKADSKTWIAWGLAGAVSLGAGDFEAKVAAAPAGVLPLAGSIAICLLPFGAVLFALRGRSARPTQAPSKARIATILAAISLGGALLALYFGLAAGPASLVSPVSSGYVGITAVLAALFLRERLNRQQVLGILLVLAGIALVGAG